MASKKSTKKTASKTMKHYPVVRSAELGSVSETAAVRVLDTARALSALNRRLYRFARVYPVNISMDPATPSGVVEVYALRDDWAVHQGVKMAYQMFSQNTEDERKALGSNMVARWEDFRIADGVAATHNELLAKQHDPTFTGTGTLMSAGEFTLSHVVDSGNTRRTFTFGTPGGTEYGILQEYDKSANAQGSPSTISGVTGAYTELNSEINTQTTVDLQQDNNQPPYDRDGVNAATPWVKIGTIGSGPAGDQKLSTGFFNAPCGLVVLVGPASDWNSDTMRFEVKAGKYKGVGGLSLLE